MPTATEAPAGVELRIGAHVLRDGLVGEVLSSGVLRFVAELQRNFGSTRQTLLAKRRERQRLIDSGVLPGFLPETSDIRSSEWTVPPPPPGLVDRRVEITGPTDRRMAVNALNSGARVWMADFEDSNSPTIGNLLGGQANLQAALNRRIDFATAEGRRYNLVENPATIVVRPRGWHLDERHLFVDAAPISASLFDFGVYLFNSAGLHQADRHRPYFYLPKLESHEEARLWNDVFNFAEDYLHLDRGEIRATVLIETILAVFEMDEILYELRDHAAGLNAGRWDYLFSVIKKLHRAPGNYLLPDRNSVSMRAPFMRAYTDLLVATCHRRGAHAIGGMAAFVPSRREPAINETALAKVREDKELEAQAGFDGSWVAHPDLVEVCDVAFSQVFGERSNQIDRLGERIEVPESELLDVTSAKGVQSADGLSNNISVTLQYLSAWLAGQGAVAINNLMEDVATAEISRSQIWQWLKLDTVLSDGTHVDQSAVQSAIEFEVTRIEQGNPDGVAQLATARTLLERLVFSDDFPEFLTNYAYDYLED